MTVRTISLILCVLTFALIVWGGHVNTTRSGMAFPDWPTSNANPMLTYAPSKWLMEGDKFWEHGHRLFASLVGLVTVLLAVVAWRNTPHASRPHTVIAGFLLVVLGTVASAVIGLQGMPGGFMEVFMVAMALMLVSFLVVAFRSSHERKILWLSLAAFAGVCLQGAFGGYTVRNNLPTWTSTTHGLLAEVFFVIVLAIYYLSSSSLSHKALPTAPQSSNRWLSTIVIGTWITIGIQFLFGALTRHTGAWGASTMWPEWSADGLFPSALEFAHSSVVIHFLHRTFAYVVALCVLWQVWAAWRTQLRTYSLVLLLLVVVQIVLGVHILFTFRSELVTTAHVMVGAAMFAISAFTSFPFVFRPIPSMSRVIIQQPMAGAHL